MTWNMMGNPAKNQPRARIREFLQDATRRELTDYLTLDGNVVRFRSNRFDMGAPQRAAALRRLSSAQRRLMARLADAEAGVIQLELEL